MDRVWIAKVTEICEELKARGITALPSHETRSCLLVRTGDLTGHAEESGWEHVITAPEVFISDDDLAAEKYKDIVLRKVTAALGYMPLP